MKKDTKTIVIKEIAESKRKLIEGLVRDAQDGYRQLQRLSADIGEIPHPKDCSLEWANSIGSTEKEIIKSSASLPQEEKKRLILQWQGIRVNATRHTQNVVKLLDYVPSERVCYDERLRVVYVRDIDELAAEKATFAVPDDAVEHWEKIKTLQTAYRELREWEEKHDAISKPFLNVMHTTEEKINELWALGTATIDSIPVEYRDRYRATRKQIL